MGGSVRAPAAQHLVPSALKGITSKTLGVLYHYLFSFQMVDVKVLKKKDNGLEVSILEDEGNVIASIPTVHLSDFVATCKLLWHCLQEGDVLPRVMCLSDNGERIVSFATSTSQTKKWGGGVCQESRVSATNRRNTSECVEVDVPVKLSVLRTVIIITCLC